MSLPASIQAWMPVAQRAMARCAELAAVSSHPDHIDRAYLTDQHKQVNALAGQWMIEAGLQSQTDPAGNLVGLRDAHKPVLVIGSHLDTVPNAGAFDGILGVLTGIEIAAALQDTPLPFGLEIIGFGEEEGVRFGTTLMTSAARAGCWQEDWWQLKDSQGVSVAQAFEAFGLDPHAVASARAAERELVGFFEIHIEQGPVLEQEDLPLGVVTGIAAAKRLHVTVSGMAGHAGTVPMNLRSDALVGAAACIAQAEKLAKQFDVVATVGQIEAFPGGVNVIPGRVRFSLDVRSLDRSAINEFLQAWQTWSVEHLKTSAATPMTFATEVFHDAPAAHCADWLQDALAGSLVHLQLPVRHLPSGAGHDAMMMATVCDAAMLFVRCEGGISHNPRENIQVEDVAWALAAGVHFVENLKPTTRN